MTHDLELDARTADRDEAYHVLSALVVPRPIAWVSTLADDGTRNLAPHSYFTVAAIDPPHIVFSSTSVRDTLTNIRANGELVVNIVAADLLVPMNETSAEVGPEVDEFELVGLTPTPATTVRPPRVAEAAAHLECRAVHELAVGDSHLVVAEVLHIHVDASVLVDGRADPARLAPVARLGGAYYATLGEIIRLPRPPRPSRDRAEEG